MKELRQSKLELKVWLIPILVSAALLLGVIFSYKGWWISFLALGLAWSFGYYAVHSLRKGLSLRREMRYGWAKVGDVLEERIMIDNTSHIPASWLEIEDHTTIGRQQSIGISVNAYGQTTWRRKHVCIRRGLYRIGPTTLHTSDIFGLYRLAIHDNKQTSILITPPVVPLPNIEIASGGRTGDGRLTKGILEQSVAVSTVRDYLPQDPLHHIHWPITAKRGELTTRVFDNTPTGNWWIIQDMNKAVLVGDEDKNTLEIGIILSASLANKGIQSGKAVGFIASNQQRSWIPPQPAGDQTMKILHKLAISEAGEISLEVLLQKSRTSFHQTASLIIITPDISTDWLESLLWLKAKGLIPTVLLLDPQSFGAEQHPRALVRQLQNEGIHTYVITADMFADQIDIEENPPWEWRVFGTGYAVPIKKPQDTTWKGIE